jgi:hypothetical protein
MKQNTLQDFLFESILSEFPNRSSAVEAISEMFGLGKDAIYRRLRGDSLLTPDEIGRLAQAFNISLDAYIFENNNTVFFRYSPFTRQVKEFSDYLGPILSDLENTVKLPNPKILYVSAEIPILHYCLIPEIIAFKLFVWGRSFWELEYLQKRQFDFDLISYPVIKMTEDLCKIYRNIPSIELWNNNLVDFTLSQIEYHVMSGDFRNPKDALIICDRVDDLMEHLSDLATHGRKSLFGTNAEESSGAGFDLYHNEMVYANNTILVSTDKGKAVYTAFGNPNFLKSTDRKMCDYTENWFLSLTQKSIPMSGHAEKNRNWFFNNIKKKVEMARKRIEAQIA